MNRIATAAACLIGLAPAAHAGPTLSIPLDLGPTGSVTAIGYACPDGQTLSVHYINADADALALMELDGQARLFVNVISGSGARYVSGVHEWWTKGDQATLTDLTDSASAQDCTAQP